MADEEFIEDLKRQGVSKGFSRYAVDYLESAGVDPRAVDIAAEYDSTLNDTENNKEFARKFPIGNEKNYTKSQVQSLGEIEQDRANQAYYEEKKNTPWVPKQKELPGARNSPSAFSRKGTDAPLDEPEPKQPSFVDKLMGKYNEVKSSYKQRQETARKERLYAATQRAKDLSEDLTVKRSEAQVRRMEDEKRFYDKQENARRMAPLLAIREGLHGFGNNVRSHGYGREPGSRMQAPQSSAQRLMFGGGNNFNAGQGDSPMLRMMAGGNAEPKKRHNYVTIAKGGKIVQVDLNDPRLNGSQGMNQAPMPQGPSMIERMSVGSGGGMQATKRGQGRHEQGLLMRLSGQGGKPSKLTRLMNGRGR